MKKIVVLLFFAFLSITLSFSLSLTKTDYTKGVKSGLIYSPSKSQDIQILKEKVCMNLDTMWASVKTITIMKNNSNKTMKVPVVFPIYQGLKHYSPGINDYIYKNFEIYINNKHVWYHIKPIKILGKEYYGFSWDMYFSPYEVKRVEIRYKYNSYKVEKGTITLFYALNTAKNWVLPIKQLDIIAKFKNSDEYYLLYRVSGGDPVGRDIDHVNHKITWHYKDFVPTNNIYIDRFER